MLNEDFLTEHLSGEIKKKFLDFCNAWGAVNGDPNDPLHLKTEGKRRKNTAIIDPNKQTACEPVRDTGCNQRI